MLPLFFFLVAMLIYISSENVRRKLFFFCHLFITLPLKIDGNNVFFFFLEHKLLDWAFELGFDGNNVNLNM